MFDLEQKLLLDGQWADFKGSQFLIAHNSNTDFQRTFAKLQSPYRRQIEKGTLDPDVSVDILCKAMSKHIMLDWKNVAAGGKTVEYTPERAYSALKNNPDLREFVIEYSLDMDNFREQEMEEEGNG